MKYSAKRIDQTIGREFARPQFHLPSRTADLFEHLFQHLSPRFALKLEDAKGLGGTSYADVKLVLVAFMGGGQFEVTPAGFSCHFVNLIQADDDVRTILDFTQTCEAAIREALKESEIRHRTFRARVWLECEGGLEAIDKLLRERGSRALELESGTFGPYDKRFTIRVDMDDPQGAMKMHFVIQRSEIQAWHLFVDSGFFFANAYPLQGLQEQFDHGRALFNAVLGHLGLEAAS
jgi:hypothetical protein